MSVWGLDITGYRHDSPTDDQFPPVVAVHEIRHCCVSLLRRGSEVAAIDGLAVQRRGRMRTDIIFRKYREAERGPTGHSNVRPAILQ